ncbi:hypothetical protein BKG95_10340 [Rodentibacter pneumotropicus]|uniref:Uncharacterized protein n=1 Tax=Rodentibacter pneumotropicus TaxID=758 RepID=A0AAW5LB68_9PAST|nr:hypothetical protein [Rodentibacter pneumotropicus]MCQ9121288.1 hypothetical protein [Rodentibacter pneumotropicus]OOF66597.1 hypothetical protein BKG95_10340 [Rodentibacter pneumotropicus]
MQNLDFEHLRNHIDELVSQKALTFDLISFILKVLLEKQILSEEQLINFLTENTSRYYGKVPEAHYNTIVEISSMIKDHL